MKSVGKSAGFDACQQFRLKGLVSASRQSSDDGVDIAVILHNVHHRINKNVCALAEANAAKAAHQNAIWQLLSALLNGLVFRRAQCLGINSVEDYCRFPVKIGRRSRRCRDNCIHPADQGFGEPSVISLGGRGKNQFYRHFKNVTLQFANDHVVVSPRVKDAKWF